MSFLENLRRGLGDIQVPAVSVHSKMARLEEQLVVLTTKLQGHKAKMPEDAINKAVEHFQREPRFKNSREALLVSLGCDRPIGKMKYRLIEDKAYFPAVLTGVDRFRTHRHIFRNCYRGLLDAYLGYHPGMKGARPSGRENWEILRAWLSVGTDFVREPDGIDELWVPTLAAHPELFSDTPVDAFAHQVLQGNAQAFIEFQRTLGIERTSWLLEQVVLAQIRAASAVGITPYVPKLLSLLEPLGSQNPLLFNQGLVEILSGYCNHSGGVLHGALRDFSLHFWGNPLYDEKQNTTGWISVPPEPRAMVKKWFKLHVIQQFFNVLAKQDEENEEEDELNKEKRERRRDFWEQYADVVGDVKFALGASARASRDPPMVEVLKLMEGMTLERMYVGDALAPHLMGHMSGGCLVRAHAINHQAARDQGGIDFIGRIKVNQDGPGDALRLGLSYGVRAGIQHRGRLGGVQHRSQLLGRDSDGGQPAAKKPAPNPAVSHTREGYDYEELGQRATVCAHPIQELCDLWGEQRAGKQPESGPHERTRKVPGNEHFPDHIGRADKRRSVEPQPWHKLRDGQDRRAEALKPRAGVPDAAVDGERYAHERMHDPAPIPPAHAKPDAIGDEGPGDGCAQHLPEGQQPRCGRRPGEQQHRRGRDWHAQLRRQNAAEDRPRAPGRKGEFKVGHLSNSYQLPGHLPTAYPSLVA
ncbi:hypothetical protein BZM27_37580 [Paraburkholderia steynii]|uniref:Zorya protein ZorC EH domain-containing protein n=1 Tax=Paraburkholderia steynii TaxID=1245441 RepID=A0A4R0X7P8_9BURK|nr:hypothetical protein BZM27_37580 [Paraburkholderia steynii]